MEENQERQALLAAAMARAQAKFGHAARRSENPTHRSRFADLAAVIDVLRAPLAEEGLWFLQPVSFTEHGMVEVTTVICHSSGEQLPAGYIQLRPMGDGPQAIGSAISYARRYGLQAAFGIAAAGEDDDGEKAEGRTGSATVVPGKGEPDPQAAEEVRQEMADPKKSSPGAAPSLDPEVVRAKLGKTPRRTQAEDALANVTSLVLLQADEGKRLAMLQGAWRKLKLQGKEQPASLGAFGKLDAPTLCLLYAALRDGLAKYASFQEPPEQEAGASGQGGPQEPAGAEGRAKGGGKAGKGSKGPAMPQSDNADRPSEGSAAQRKAAEMAAAATGETVDDFMRELEKGGDPA